MNARLYQQLKPYGVALISVAIAMVVSHFLQPFARMDRAGGFLVLLGAVAVASWYGGYGPGIVAIVASAIFSAWIMLEPTDSIRISHTDDVIRFSIFVGVALLVGSMHAARARAERVLRDAEQRLGFALSSTGIGCWDADIKSGRFWHSANLPAIFGRPEDGFSTTYEGFFAYIHSEDRDFMRLATMKPSEGKTDYEITHRIICANGSLQWVRTRGQMFLGSAGNVERMVGVSYQLENKPASTSDAPAATATA